MLLILLAGGASCAYSMIVESGNTVVIDSTTNADIYVIAGTVIINAPVHGDLVAAGGKIYINDTVNNVLLAGGTVEINGYITGKIRCLGGTLKLSRMIEGDLVAAAGDITIGRNAGVSGDVLAAGGNLYIYGNVGGNIRAAAGKFQLFGSVGRDLYCRGGSVEVYGKVMGAAALSATDALTIGESASFQGPVRYWAAVPVDFGHSLAQGHAVVDESLSVRQKRWYFLGGAGWLAVFWYMAAALLIIALMQYFFGAWFERAGAKAYDRPLPALGWGVVYFAGVPVAAALCFISLIAIPVGLVLIMGYVFTLLVCGSITSLVASHWFAHVLGTGGNVRKYIWGAFGLFILFRLILSVPFFGWALSGLMVCVSFGALLTSVRWKGRRSGSAIPGGEHAAAVAAAGVH